MPVTLLVSLVLALTELAVIVIASPLARPLLVLRFLPEDIREAAKDHPEPPKWKQYTAHLLLVLFVLVWLGGFIVIGADGLKQGCGFGQLWLRYTVSLELIKLFDLGNWQDLRLPVPHVLCDPLRCAHDPCAGFFAGRHLHA